MEHGAQPSTSHGACAVAPRRANEVRAVPGRNNFWPRSPPLSEYLSGTHSLRERVTCASTR